MSLLVDGLERARCELVGRADDLSDDQLKKPLLILDGTVINQTIVEEYRRHFEILSSDRPIRRQIYSLIARWLLPVQEVGHDGRGWDIDRRITPSARLLANWNRLLQENRIVESEVIAVCLYDGLHVPIADRSKRSRQETNRKRADNVKHRFSDYDSWVDALRSLQLRERTFLQIGWGQRGGKMSLSPCGVLDLRTRGEDRSDEVSVASGCTFLWSDCAGCWWTAAALGRPVLLTNVYASYRYDRKRFLYYPVSWLRNDGSLVDATEWLTFGVSASHTYWLERHGLRIVRNSAEEMAEAVSEMSLRVAGKWIESSRDAERRRQFEKLHSEVASPWSLNVATSFLRNHWS